MEFRFWYIKYYFHFILNGDLKQNTQINVFKIAIN